MKELPKQYNPRTYEPRVCKKWEESGAFAPNPKFIKEGKQPFVIMLPLPNVTGNLHMGHALQHTLSDVLIRYHRMKGEPTLWQPGTDHAGIATQNVVEKELRKEGLSRHDLGREKFLERVWAWKEKYGNEIVEQMKRMGSSCDWSRFVFTMDKKYIAAVHETFIRYHKKGYIYRGTRIVNWCPRCASVISDLEIEHEDRDGTLYTIQYPLKGSEDYIEIATTRPETMMGDTAVAVHPDGAKRDLVGRTAILPLMNREIPVIADDRIDKTFGTGALKVTPAHDMLDAEIGETHGLEAINVIGEDGRITDAGGKYAGMSTEDARKQIIADLKRKNLFVREEQYRHTITLCERCGSVIEPLLSRQWFVDMSRLKDQAIEVVEKDIVKFFGPRWKKYFLEWMRNVKDWTISRQLWWGQPVPVWWKPGVRGTDQEEGNYVVSVKKPKGDYERDPDVLDTWFSSAIWPLGTLGWPEHTEDLKVFYPTSVLATAREILYLWVARMVFSGLELLKGEEYGNRPAEDRIPFHHVLVHPTVLTKDGKRMSKSLGTGLDPMNLVGKYGADATRFGLMYQISFDSQAVRFDEAVIVSARNFANKLWNLARLVQSLPDRAERTVADTWILQRADHVSGNITTLLGEYKLGEAARMLYDFAWKDFADWYVEIVKHEGSTDVARSVFEQILVLTHPFMPHITEVLWENFGQEGMLITHAWPQKKGRQIDERVMDRLRLFQDTVNTIRSARMLLGIAPSSTVRVYCESTPELVTSLQQLAHAELVDAVSDNMPRFPLHTEGWIAIGSPDITAESITRAQSKLEQEICILKTLIGKQRRALARMRGKAPDEIIEGKRAIIADAKQRICEIKCSLDMLL